MTLGSNHYDVNRSDSTEATEFPLSGFIIIQRWLSPAFISYRLGSVSCDFSESHGPSQRCNRRPLLRQTVLVSTMNSGPLPEFTVSVFPQRKSILFVAVKSERFSRRVRLMSGEACRAARDRRGRRCMLDANQIKIQDSFQGATFG